MTSRVLFVTTNGVGLGHLTRSMAIARRLADGVAPVFLTMSQAVPIVRQQGFLVEYLHSPGVLGTDRYDWQLLLEDRLARLCATYAPDVVVFDGAFPYHGLCARMVADPTRAWVWNRRAMWRPGRGADAVKLATLFDDVLEPGEVAAAADRGATVPQRREVRRLEPVLLCGADEILDRAAARERLGVPADAACALLQLGAGSINDIGTLRGIATTVLREHGIHVVIGESPLAPRSDTSSVPEVTTVRTYPLQPLLPAFDLAVAAAGYNSFHELVAAGLPTVFAPNSDTQTDDQVARARYAEEAGFARSWEEQTPEGFARAVRPLLDAVGRERLRSAAPRVDLDAGAAAAARFIEGLMLEAPR